MSLDRMLQVLLPQPGDDLRSWASSLVSQLQFLLQQQANDTQMLSSAPATAPLYQSDGNTLVITDVGEYKLTDGTVIVDATGLHVKDATGFDVINGPTIRIDTQHLVDAAIETAKLAAGAVTNTIIADNSISTGKLQANSVVAGKIAANAIVAGDAVIANAAIVDAQIATLNASKINAGDIAAARMSTNIVTALEGKFATLSALAASLGVVQIQTGGALLTQGVTTYTSGTGLWTGENGGVYKFRIGNPTGARLDWDGSTIRIYDSLNSIGFQSGETSLGLNLIPGLRRWTHNGTNFVYTSHPFAPDGNLLVIPDGAANINSDSPTVDISFGPGTFTLTFYAQLESGSSVTMHVDLFPDTLPESEFVVTGTRQFYTITWTSSHADLAACKLRFFRFTGAGQVVISTIKLTYGTKITPWMPHRADTVSVDNQLSASNVTTYMTNATIGTAQIIDANITTAKIADAAIQSAKIGDLQVGTIKIANAAVTQHFSTFTSSPRITTATETTVATISSLTTSTGDTLMLLYTQVANNNLGTVESPIINVYRDSTLIESHTVGLSASERDLYSLHLSHVPGAGTFTYTVKIQTTGTVDISMDSSGDFSIIVFKK